MINICIITGTRAEYGLLQGLIKQINESSYFNLLLFVTGSHLEEKYGFTYKNIESDGFVINEKIYMDLNDDSSKGILKSMAKELNQLADCFDKYNIDIILILGDRYEMLIAAQAALIYNIPIGHLCGGDVTEGAYDNFIRNAITKISTYHFVTCQSSYNNIINMNEDKNNIFLVGNPGLYDIYNFIPIPETVLYNKLKIIKKKYLILVVYHSETLLSYDENKNNFDTLIDSLLCIRHFDITNYVFIHSNADSFNNYIFETINKMTTKYKNIHSYKSLDRKIYLNIINYCDLFIGNSSSGIYEVPLFKKITLNIGNRQLGRISSDSVIHTEYNKNIITDYIHNILNNNYTIKNNYSYEILETDKLILNILKKFNNSSLIII